MRRFLFSDCSVSDSDLWFGLQKKRFEKFVISFRSLEIKDMTGSLDDNKSPIIS